MRTLLFLLLQMCLNGKCVSEEENSLDYGGGGGDEFLQRTGTAIISTTFGQPPSPPLRFPPPSARLSSLLQPCTLFLSPPLKRTVSREFRPIFFCAQKTLPGLHKIRLKLLTFSFSRRYSITKLENRVQSTTTWTHIFCETVLPVHMGPR